MLIDSAWYKDSDSSMTNILMYIKEFYNNDFRKVFGRRLDRIVQLY